MATTEPKAAIKPPLQQGEPKAAAPEPEMIVEVINVAGTLMQRTFYPETGECETEILDERRIPRAQIEATRAMQRRRGR